MTAPPAGALEACLALLEDLRKDSPAPRFAGCLEIRCANFLRQHGPALLAALRLREGWRPIESAPKDGTSVLVHGTSWIGEPMICEWDMTYGGWFVTGYGDGVSPAPTHWMPLPAPPTADDLARILESER